MRIAATALLCALIVLVTLVAVRLLPTSQPRPLTGRAAYYACNAHADTYDALKTCVDTANGER